MIAGRRTGRSRDGTGMMTDSRFHGPGFVEHDDGYSIYDSLGEKAKKKRAPYSPAPVRPDENGVLRRGDGKGNKGKRERPVGDGPFRLKPPFRAVLLGGNHLMRSIFRDWLNPGAEIR